MRRAAGLLAAALWLLAGGGRALAAPLGPVGPAAQAQLPAAQQRQQGGGPPAQAPAPYDEPEQAWREHRFLVGAFGGRLTSGTSLGTIDNVFFRSTFDTGGDTLVGFRVGWAVAARFDAELEYGRAEPGVVAVLSDLQGRSRTEVPFADLSIEYVTAGVTFAVIERSHRLVPYLMFGVGVVDASSDAEPTIGGTEIGLLYGIGLKARASERIWLRGELRGLRSGFGRDRESELPGLFRGEFRSSNLLWSMGVEVRF